MSALAEALVASFATAADARWFVIGRVTAYAASRVTATIDGASVPGIRKVASWPTPAAGQVALFGAVRSGTTVQYLGLGAIDGTGVETATLPSNTLFPSPDLFPGE